MIAVPSNHAEVHAQLSQLKRGLQKDVPLWLWRTLRDCSWVTRELL